MSAEGALKNQEGQVFNIQRFSTHDGPGIRTVVFLKGCPLRCFWCQNPESQSLKPVLMFKKERCTACGRCIDACPNHACYRDGDGILVNREKCKACGTCIGACLNEARTVEGKAMSVDEVVKILMKDERIYENSGGGMTISGGECVMQPDFTIALLKASHDEGLTTAVEITGIYPWEKVKAVTDHADYILYDLKSIDNEKHKQGTGVSNETILENAKKLVRSGKNIRFRMPLIPGFNDSLDDVKAVAVFIREELGLDPAERLELLAYNTLGEEKYNRLDCGDKKPSYKRQSDEYMQELRNCVASI